MTLYRGPTVPHWKQGQIHRTMIKKPLKQHWTCFFFTANVRFIPQHRCFYHFGSVFGSVLCVCLFVCSFCYPLPSRLRHLITLGRLFVCLYACVCTAHCGWKSYGAIDINLYPMRSKASDWASDWAQRSARVNRALLSKRMSERSERTSDHFSHNLKLICVKLAVIFL